MSKKIIEIVELQLGIDTDKLSTKPSISNQTQNKIESYHEAQLKNKEIEDNAKNKIQEAEQSTNKQIIECFNKLLEVGDIGIDSIVIIGMCSGKSMLSIMVRLNNLIKKRGSLWKVHKRKNGGKTFYYLKIT